MLQIKSQTETR